MNSETDSGRAPCLIGTARRTWRDGEVVPEPLDMWHQLVRAAAEDVGIGRDIVADIDDLGLVHCQSWHYDQPVHRLADRLGLGPGRRTESLLAGTSPQRLINAAATRMLAGEVDVAVVVGGEALSTLRRYSSDGVLPPWSHPHPDPPRLPVDLDEWYLPTELAHGVLPAWLTFALLEQARWAARGAQVADRRRLGATMAGLSAVAAHNPDAWFRHSWEPGDLLTPGPRNRMVATPYTKLMTAFMDVDMAAANLLVTRATADSWGVPDDRRVYLRGWGFARDATHLAARTDLARSPAMIAASAEANRMAGIDLDQVDVFDLYSCFGSAVQFARDALGLADSETRPTTVTGGLPYHGGPSSNYMSHSISHMADHLRTHPEQAGMVTGIGMHMTKHVAALWSARPGPIRATAAHHERQRWDDTPVTPDVAVAATANGPARVAAATTVFDRHRSTEYAVAICELPDGRRCYARSDDERSVTAVTQGAWVTEDAHLCANDDGTNELCW